VLIFASDKCFGLFDIGHRVLEGNTAIGKKELAFCIVFLTIHGIPFLCLGGVICVPFCFPHVLAV
jgi:hypothetical protein